MALHVLLLLLTLLSALCAATVVVTPLSEAGRVLDTPVLGFSLDADVARPGLNVVAFDDSWCEDGRGPPSGLTYTNTVLHKAEYTDACFRIGYGAVVRMCRSVGASAMLWTTAFTAGHEVYVIHDFKDWEDAEGYPMFEISPEDNDWLKSQLRQGTNVTLDVDATPNPWLDFFAGPWIAVQVICSLMALVVLILATQRLVAFIKRYRKEGQYKVAVAVLALETLGNALRLLQSAVDPGWSRQIFSYGLGRFLITVSIPIGLLSAVLLFLAWNDMLTASFTMRASVFRTRRSQILFLVAACILVGFDLATSLLASFEGLVDLSDVTAIVMAVFTLLVAGGILFVGSRLLSKLNEYEGGKMNSDLSRVPRTPPASPQLKTASKTETSSGGHGEASRSSFDGGTGGGFATTTGETRVESSYGRGESGATSKTGSGFVGSALKAVTSFRVMGSGSSGTARSKSDRVRRLTRRIRWMAVFLALSAVAIALAGQGFVFFVPEGRAAAFVVFYATQSLRSFFTISFFEPK